MKTCIPFALFLSFTLLSAGVSRAQCKSTLFAANGGLPFAGATVYFDVTAAAPVAFASLEVNCQAAAGEAVGYEVWTSAGSYVGNQANPAVWVLASTDDGLAVSNGRNLPTPVDLMMPVTLPAGLSGVAIVSVAGGHSYTNGYGANQRYVGVSMTLDLGSSSTAPFGGSVFDPRVWNGSLCIGTGARAGLTFCDPNEVNSTGMPTYMSATWGTGVGSDLHLDASQGPPSQFGYFLVGTLYTDPGIVPPNCLGRYCLHLGGSFGRYHGGAGIPFNSLGQFDPSGVLQNLVNISTRGTGYDVPAAVPISG